MEVETDASKKEFKEVQSDRRRSAGDEENDDDEEFIFYLIFNPASTRAATPVGTAAKIPSLAPAAAPVRRAAPSTPLIPTADAQSSTVGTTNVNSGPIEVGTIERVSYPSIGSEKTDVYQPRADLTRVERRWRHTFACAGQKSSTPARSSRHR